MNGAKAIVYVMSTDSGRVKVGLTQDLLTRRAGLRWQKKLASLDIAYRTRPTEKAGWIEAEALRVLRQETGRKRGEWFTVSVDRAIAAVSEAERQSQDVNIQDVPRIRPIMVPMQLTLTKQELEMVERVQKSLRKNGWAAGRATTIRYMVAKGLATYRAEKRSRK